jgi:hypothetical protein
MRETILRSDEPAHDVALVEDEVVRGERRVEYVGAEAVTIRIRSRRTAPQRRISIDL